MDALDSTTHIKQIVERKFNISLTETWVKECLNFLKPLLRRPGSTPRQDHIVEIVSYQLLLNDMKLVCDGSGPLPEGIALKHREILKGEYLLQLEVISNIGASLSRYSEDNKDDDFIEPEDTDAPPGPTRMFKMLLTDGVQYVPAIEFLPIPALHAAITVGTTKLLVKDVRIRRGIMQLTPACVRVLEVQSEQAASNAHFVPVDPRAVNLLHRNTGSSPPVNRSTSASSTNNATVPGSAAAADIDFETDFDLDDDILAEMSQESTSLDPVTEPNRFATIPDSANDPRSSTSCSSSESHSAASSSHKRIRDIESKTSPQLQTMDVIDDFDDNIELDSQDFATSSQTTPAQAGGPRREDFGDPSDIAEFEHNSRPADVVDQDEDEDELAIANELWASQQAQMAAPRTPPRDHKMQPTLTTIPPGSTATVPIILLKVQDVLQTSSAYVVTFLVVDGSSGQVPEFTKVGAGAQWVPSIPHQKLVLNSDITEGAVGTPSFIYCNTRDRLKALKEQPSWTPAEKAERKQLKASMKNMKEKLRKFLSRLQQLRNKVVEATIEAAPASQRSPGRSEALNTVLELKHESFQAEST